MQYKEILEFIKNNHNKKNVEGMARFGINCKNAYGVSIPKLRELAKKIGKNHDLAQRLWKTGIHEARILAGYVDDPLKVSTSQMDQWVTDFDSWDICDQICSSLFDKTHFSYKKTYEWVASEEEYVKRAGYVMIAVLAVHDKKTSDKQIVKFLPVIIKGSKDERKFVKKAVNWALRQIGKRSRFLNEEALKTAQKILKIDSKAAKWIATDAIRELTDKKTVARIKT